MIAKTSGSVEEEADLQQLFKRRVPQMVMGAIVAAVGFLGFVGLLVEMGTLGPLYWSLSLPFATCGVASATIIAWFHGETGKQQANVLEWIMLSVIGVIWLTITGWMVLGA